MIHNLDEEDNYAKLFEYILYESYMNIDNILEDVNIRPVLDQKNNSLYNKMKYVYPMIEEKMIKSYCFTMIYLLSIFIKDT